MASKNTAKKLNGESERIMKPPRIVEENNNVLDRRSEDEAILSNPMLKIEVVFAKRIRNLEKRKQKLLQYGEQQKNGKPLERDQMEAYSRLDEVLKQLEFLYEMRTIIEENAKCYQQALEKMRQNDIKKRTEAEWKKLSTLIRYQELSNVLGNSLVRKAFLGGSAGTAQLSEQELSLVDTLYAVLNPSLESVCDVGEWMERSDECARIVAEILNGSEKVVIMQHSGNDLKNLLEKVSKFDLANILKLLEESRQKESMRDKRNVLDAMNQTEAKKTTAVTIGNDVDECDATVTSSVGGSNRSQMRNDPVIVEDYPDKNLPAIVKETIVVAKKSTDPERMKEKSKSASATPIEHEYKRGPDGARSLPHLEHGSHKRYGRRHTWNEGHSRGLHGHRITQYPTYEVDRHEGCNICNISGSAQGNFIDSNVHNGYYATMSPYSFTGSVINEPYYCVAYPNHYFNTQQLRCCCAGNAIVNEKSEILTEGGDCMPPGYVSSDLQHLTREMNRIETMNTHFSHP